jgi:hypothetical protein
MKEKLNTHLYKHNVKHIYIYIRTVFKLSCYNFATHPNDHRTNIIIICTLSNEIHFSKQAKTFRNGLSIQISLYSYS